MARRVSKRGEQTLRKSQVSHNEAVLDLVCIGLQRGCKWGVASIGRLTRFGLVSARLNDVGAGNGGSWYEADFGLFSMMFLTFGESLEKGLGVERTMKVWLV